MSIGDVLNALRDEFPDITISKIRFLESQGLIDPERTPSGYRKFYGADVQRLRFILREQKDNFLPLKVIKERLDELDEQGGVIAVEELTIENGAASEPDAGGKRDEGGADSGGGAGVDQKRRPKRPSREPALFEQTRKAREIADARRTVAGVADDEGPEDLATPSNGVSLTRAELGNAAGLTDDELASLEEFGLLHPMHTAGDRALFDEDALAVARAAAGFMRHGIEPRHLRMYRAFAEREAGLFEQVLLPYRRQRNPEAQARTSETLGELAGLGRRLRTALLRQSVRRTLGG
jgi:DNA-binding transcriptional MerR regulator